MNWTPEVTAANIILSWIEEIGMIICEHAEGESGARLTNKAIALCWQGKLVEANLATEAAILAVQTAAGRE